jgi:hypothetical protein
LRLGHKYANGDDTAKQKIKEIVDQFDSCEIKCLDNNDNYDKKLRTINPNKRPEPQITESFKIKRSHAHKLQIILQDLLTKIKEIVESFIESDILNKIQVTKNTILRLVGKSERD